MSQKAQSNLPQQQMMQGTQPIISTNANAYPMPYSTAYSGGVMTQATPAMLPQTQTQLISQPPIYQNQVYQNQVYTGASQLNQVYTGGQLYSGEAMTRQVTTQPQIIQQAGQVQTEVVGSYQGQTIKGESRIEYIPFQREVTDYVTQEVVEYVPREKRVTDYYAIEYTTEYVPQVYQEKYVEYVPVEQIKERVEYQAIQKQTVIQQPTFQENITTQQYVQPIQQTYVPQVQTTGGYRYSTGQSQFVGQPTMISGAAQYYGGSTTLPATTQIIPSNQFVGGASYYGGSSTQVIGQPQFVGGSTQVLQGQSYLPTTYTTGGQFGSPLQGGFTGGVFQGGLQTTTGYTTGGFTQGAFPQFTQGGFTQGGYAQGGFTQGVVPGQARQSNAPSSQIPGQQKQ